MGRLAKEETILLLARKCPEMACNYYPQFLTSTILEWKQLLVLASMKQIIISSLQYLVNEGLAKMYGFVLMANHIHRIWQIRDGHEKAKVQ